jgi:hypothetical protein
MKATTLIRLLEDLVEHNGDLPVRIDNGVNTIPVTGAWWNSRSIDLSIGNGQSENES